LFLFFSWIKKQFFRFKKRGNIQNKTSCTGYLRNLKNIARDIGWSFYLELYDSVNGKLKKKDRDAITCSVTGEEISKNREDVIDWVGMKQLSIYMAHKTGLIKVGELKFRKTEGFD